MQHGQLPKRNIPCLFYIQCILTSFTKYTSKQIISASSYITCLLDCPGQLSPYFQMLDPAAYRLSRIRRSMKEGSDQSEAELTADWCLALSAAFLSEAELTADRCLGLSAGRADC